MPWPPSKLISINAAASGVVEKSGMAETQYQGYENNRRVPNVLIAAKLANAIGCTLDSLTDDCTLV